MIFQEDQSITRIRRVYTSDSGTVAVEEADETFIGRVYPPSQPKKGPSDDASPRSYTPVQPLWYRPGRMSSPALAGDRFDADGITYEAMADEHGKRAGLQVLLYEVELQPLASVYPTTAQLQELGGIDVGDPIPCAFWTSSKSSTGQGMYQDLIGEFPIEFYDALNVINRQLLIGGNVYKIGESLIRLAQPHVRVSLKGES